MSIHNIYHILSIIAGTNGIFLIVFFIIAAKPNINMPITQASKIHIKVLRNPTNKHITETSFISPPPKLPLQMTATKNNIEQTSKALIK